MIERRSFLRLLAAIPLIGWLVPRRDFAEERAVSELISEIPPTEVDLVDLYASPSEIVSGRGARHVFSTYERDGHTYYGIRSRDGAFIYEVRIK